MSLLFLLTYIGISYFIYKKNKTNKKINQVTLQINGIIAFALLFVFLIYYSEVNLSASEKMGYVYSFYFLIIGYLITYIVNFFYFRKLLLKNKYKQIISSNVGILETIINKVYFIVILGLSIVYFLYTNPGDIFHDDGIQVLLYIFFIFSSIFVLFKNKLLS